MVSTVKNTEFLVVDSNCFINNVRLQDYGSNIYTVSNVLAEIKDKATRQRLKVLPYELIIREPNPKSFTQVIEFSKKSGDAQSLSNTDLKVIALTLDLEKDYIGVDHIRSEPLLTQAQKEAAFKQAHNKHIQDDLTDTTLDNQNISETVESVENKNEEEQLPDEANASSDDNTERSDEEEEEESDEDWITPDNFDDHAKTGFGLEKIVPDSESDIPPPRVACMTSDFAMQNVLIQMGLKLVGYDGFVIKRPRSFALWCYACFATVLKTGVYFCPKCGNDTLHRIPVALQDDGSLRWFFKKGYRFNLRNTIYSIPRPEGGKHAQNPIFVADQPLPQQRPKRSKNSLLSQLDESDWRDIGNDFNPFSVHDLTSRAASLGIKGSRGCRDDRLTLKPTRGPFQRKKSKR